MRVVVADPPAYTPPYDRSLGAALARAGADVELVTSRFRFGAVAPAEGYDAREWFYPLSSRMGGTRLRLAVKALEHPLGMARFAATKPDVIHMQWLGAPEVDRWMFHPRSPAVLTAHDVIPRRTLSKTAMWRRLFGRFERVVVHSERGRGQLADFGIPEAKLRVIGHPVFRSEIGRADDGRTALCLGLIRPYKGTEDSVEAVLGVDGARLLVVGDPRVPLDGLRRTGRRPRGVAARVPTRLGASPRALRGDGRALSLPGGDRRLGRAPAGTRCRRARRSSTTSADWARSWAASAPAPSSRRGTSRRCRPRSSNSSETRRRSPRLGAAPSEAREELTWDASAAAHLELYRELA